MRRTQLDGLIIPAEGRWRRPALELLAATQFADLPGAFWALDRETAGVAAAESGLFVARRAAVVQGAIWAQRLASGTTALWGPVLAKTWDPDVASALLTAALSHATTVVHALVRQSEPAMSQALRQAGFRAGGAVGFLACDKSNFPATTPRLPCALPMITAERSTRVLDILQRTFEDTLDCPELAGGISAKQMLELYLTQCDHHWWFVASEKGHDAGCLLTGCDEQATALTLQYVGVVTQFRGRGWGAALTRYALWIAGQRGLATVELAVDLRNWPAAQIYRDLGFEMGEQRDFWLLGPR